MLLLLLSFIWNYVVLESDLKPPWPGGQRDHMKMHSNTALYAT